MVTMKRVRSSIGSIVSTHDESNEAPLTSRLTLSTNLRSDGHRIPVNPLPSCQTVSDGRGMPSTHRSFTMTCFLVCCLGLAILEPACAFQSVNRIANSKEKQSLPNARPLFVVEPKQRTEAISQESILANSISTRTFHEGTSPLLDPFESLAINATNEDASRPTSSDDEQTPPRSEHEEATEGDATGDKPEDADVVDDRAQRLARIGQADALLSRRSPRTKGRSGATSKSPPKSTSVGERRVGSATKARGSATRSMTRLADAMRRGATTNTSSSTLPTTAKPKDPPDDGSSPSMRSNLSESQIHSTVESMLNTQHAIVLGETQRSRALRRHTLPPFPGTLLLEAERSTKPWRPADRVSVRVATDKDDLDIANLRLSVFSDFSVEMRKTFCSKSCQVLCTRRNRGATCVVATVPRYGSIISGRPDIILGSAECSFHEFDGTLLGQQRQRDSILYVTEVAVSPTSRRKGVGMKLMEVGEHFVELFQCMFCSTKVSLLNFLAVH